MLFNTGQIAVPAPGRSDRVDWSENLLPNWAPPKIRAVVERYLRLRLDADRPENVRHSRDALRHLVKWPIIAHPETTNLANAYQATGRTNEAITMSAQNFPEGEDGGKGSA